MLRSKIEAMQNGLTIENEVVQDMIVRYRDMKLKINEHDQKITSSVIASMLLELEKRLDNKIAVSCKQP